MEVWICTRIPGGLSKITTREKEVPQPGKKLGISRKLLFLRINLFGTRRLIFQKLGKPLMTRGGFG